MTERARYLIPINGKLIEVEREVYEIYYQMDRRARYIEERERDNGVVSYQAIETQGIDGEVGLKDPNEVLMEDSVITQEILAQLYRCIAALPRAERELILAIYYEGLSPKDYAERIGLTKRGVNGQRKRILAKMRDYLLRMDEG